MIITKIVECSSIVTKGLLQIEKKNENNVKEDKY